jgi:hypothetical protein
MSATRDKTQKITFVYSNLYSIYRKGVERAREGAIRESGDQSPSAAAEALTELASVRSPQVFESGLVIKAKDLRAPAERATPPAPPRVTPYTPAELLGKRVVARPAATPAQAQKAAPQAVASLKENLQSLNDLQARLRFMLTELEDLIKE